MQVLMARAVERLTAVWECAPRWSRGPRLVPIADNYDHLGFDPEAVTRDVRYTRYVDAQRMLRSHASAMVPPALRAVARSGAEDVVLVCPGIVFRRDAIDWQHTGTPHQLDLWRVTRRPVGDAELDAMILHLLDAVVPGRAHRQQARVHPYTVRGRQVDVQSDGRWVEVWECGVAHPEVLRRAGLAGWNGLALGMGLDRLLMLVKGIPDIRRVRSTDPRVARQMLDLAPYGAVSAMPAVTRDLSMAVDAADDDETLGDRVRDALGLDAACVEEVVIVSSTPYDDLPASAVARLGASPGHKNVLVRVVLRDLEDTLTDKRANTLRNRVYGALHRGSVFQWATDVERSGPEGGRRR